jgi:hypothetical protein
VRRARSLSPFLSLSSSPTLPIRCAPSPSLCLHHFPAPGSFLSGERGRERRAGRARPEPGRRRRRRHGLSGACVGYGARSVSWCALDGPWHSGTGPSGAGGEAAPVQAATATDQAAPKRPSSPSMSPSSKAGGGPEHFVTGDSEESERRSHGGAGVRTHTAHAPRSAVLLRLRRPMFAPHQ